MSNTDDESPTFWTPLLAIDDDTWLGFFEGISFVGTRTTPRRPMDLAEPTPALPLLKKRYVDVLCDTTRRESLSQQQFETLLDVNSLLHLALTMGSDYWAQLAMTWVGENSLTDILKEDLISLQHARWSSQKSRHRARRILGRKMT